MSVGSKKISPASVITLLMLQSGVQSTCSGISSTGSRSLEICTSDFSLLGSCPRRGRLCRPYSKFSNPGLPSLLYFKQESIDRLFNVLALCLITALTGGLALIGLSLTRSERSWLALDLKESIVICRWPLQDSNWNLS